MSKIPPHLKDSLIVFIFCIIPTIGIYFYSEYVESARNSISIIIVVPFLLMYTLPSKVLPIIWKITGVFLSLAITACYFGTAWPQKFVLMPNGYYTVADDPVGLFPYVNIICIISLLFLLLVFYYKFKIKKVSVFD